MCCSHPYGVSFEDATSSFPYTSIKPRVVLGIILRKNTQLSECGNHKGQPSDMEKVCLHVCVWVWGGACFVMKTKQCGAELSWWCVIIAEWADWLHLLFWSVLKRHVCMREHKHDAWHQTPDRLTDKSWGWRASGAAAPPLQDSTSAVYKKARTVGLSPISSVPAERNDLFISHVRTQALKTISEFPWEGCYIKLAHV